LRTTVSALPAAQSRHGYAKAAGKLLLRVAELISHRMPTGGRSPLLHAVALPGCMGDRFLKSLFDVLERLAYALRVRIVDYSSTCL
jgi:hypothetical protein